MKIVRIGNGIYVKTRDAAIAWATCKSCGKTFHPSYGEYARCQECLAKQHAEAERAAGVE